jgi:hypothetical protein
MSLLNILLEGKKETLIDRYKDSINFEDFESLLGDFIDQDPSATKKYSEWMIKELVRLWNSDYDGRSLVDLMNFMGDEIKKFHEYSNSISENDVEFFFKKINEAEARGIKYFDSESKANQLKRSPKHINSYPTIWTVQVMNNSVDIRKRIKKEEEEAKKNVNKIYEDDRFLIVEPFNYKASCFYGANTKWCTTGTERDFNRYTNEGRLIYIIDKSAVGNATLGKMALLVEWDGSVSVWDQQDNVRSLQFLLDRFSPIEELIKKIIKSKSDYGILKQAIEGGASALKQPLSSEYFDYYKDGNVYFTFPNESDYFSWFSEVMNEYEIDLLSVVLNDPNFYYDQTSSEFDSALEENSFINYILPESFLKDMKELFRIFNNELTDCFPYSKKIDMEKLKSLKGKKGLKKSDVYPIEFNNTERCRTQTQEFLVDEFPTLIDSIRDSFTEIQSELAIEGVIKNIYETYCNVLDVLGFKLYKDDNDYCFFRYYISIEDLIALYDYFNFENPDDYLIDDIIRYSIDSQNINVGFVEDLVYDHLGNIDYDKLNERLSEELEIIFEKFMSDLWESDSFEDYDKYKEISEYVKSKYGFNKPIKIKNIDQDIQLIIKNVDPKTNGLQFEIMNKDTDQSKTVKSKLSTFESLLNNYSMFDILDIF